MADYAELNVMAHEAYMVAHDHGFWDKDDTEDTPYVKLALIHSEVSEALEVLRDGNAPMKVWHRLDGKPEGFGPELADILIRTLDLAMAYGLDIGHIVAEKMEFNKTRPRMHGKQV